MAKATFAATISAAGNASAVNVQEKVAAMDYTAVAADIATLVADGASPTEAHVTALNGHWTTFKAQVDAATGQVSSNVLVTIDKASFGTISKLVKVFNALIGAARSSGEFTE